jgi:phage tail P2-like protein
MSDYPSLLPPNATSMERAVEQSTARLGEVGAPLRPLWNPQTCPVELLPWLAWALSIDNWQSDWPEYIKRSRIAAAIEIQRHKGTVRAVKDTVASFGGAVDVVEWWQKSPAGIPHTFDLTLTLSGNDGETATAQFVNDVIAEVDKVKPVRSHYTFTQGVALSTREGTAPYARALVFARLELSEDTN